MPLPVVSSESEPLAIAASSAAGSATRPASIAAASAAALALPAARRPAASANAFGAMPSWIWLPPAVPVMTSELFTDTAVPGLKVVPVKLCVSREPPPAATSAVEPALKLIVAPPCPEPVPAALSAVTPAVPPLLTLTVGEPATWPSLTFTRPPSLALMVLPDWSLFTFSVVSRPLAGSFGFWLRPTFVVSKPV